MVPLRVLQLVTGFARSGAELLALTLAKCLQGRDCHFLLCAREDGPTRTEAGGAETVVLPKRRTLDPTYLRTLVGVVQSHRIQLIHTHLFGNDLYGFLASCLTGCQVIHTLHGWDSLRSHRRRVAYRFMAKRAARVIAISEILEAEFKRRIPIREDKLRVIHNGIAVERYGNPIDPHALRRRLGLPLVGPLIGMVGNIKPVKGIDILLASVPRIATAYPNASYVIMGETYNGYESYRASLDDLIDRLGIRDHVTFVGSTNTVPEILAALDIYVVPSRSEGLSLALLEAMASRLPVVATAVGGTPGVVRDEVTGLLIRPESPADLAARVCRLLAEPLLARQLGQAARKLVADRYHTREMAARYLALYQEVIGRASR